MVEKYKGPHPFDKKVIESWNNNQGGVYYCGVLDNNTDVLLVYYVGKAFGDEGIRGRLIQHLNESKWYDITHFGYRVCSSEDEALAFEDQEIKRLNPKYNKQGKF